MLRSGEVDPFELDEMSSINFELVCRSSDACFSNDLRVAPFLLITYFSTASCMIFLSDVDWCRMGTIGGVGLVSAVRSEKLCDRRWAGGGGIDRRFFGLCAASVSSLDTVGAADWGDSGVSGSSSLNSLNWFLF